MCCGMYLDRARYTVTLTMQHRKKELIARECQNQFESDCTRCTSAIKYSEFIRNNIRPKFCKKPLYYDQALGKTYLIYCMTFLSNVFLDEETPF